MAFCVEKYFLNKKTDCYKTIGKIILLAESYHHSVGFIGMLPKINDTMKVGNPGTKSMISCILMSKIGITRLVTPRHVRACQMQAENDMIAEIK